VVDRLLASETKSSRSVHGLQPRTILGFGLVLGLALANGQVPTAAEASSHPDAAATPQVAAQIASTEEPAGGYASDQDAWFAEVDAQVPKPVSSRDVRDTANDTHSANVPTLAVTPRLDIEPDKKFGVAQTVTMRFPIAVSERRAVEQGITISGNKSLPPGRWVWVDEQTAVYRTKKFWPGKATIKFRLDLNKVAFGSKDGSQYQGSSSASQTYTLHTARKLIMKIQSKSHRMRVLRDGKLWRTIPVSLGKPGWETYSGIKVLTGAKYRKIRLVGGGKTGASWDVISPYSIPITTDGEFLHAAPWARYRIGKAAGSHGCTNMNIEDARWIFKRVREGDPVVTRGTGVRMNERLSIGQGKAWTHSWRKWKKLSNRSSR
jgi:lipoprotein-anchoring transpeptidase ErfK/SrfK